MENQTMLSTFEWSESGLNLLKKINTQIERLGGVKRVAIIIEAESNRLPIRIIIPERGVSKKWSNYEILFLQNNHKLMKYKEISFILNRTVRAVNSQMKNLKRRAKTNDSTN